MRGPNALYALARKVVHWDRDMDERNANGCHVRMPQFDKICAMPLRCAYTTCAKIIKILHSDLQARHCVYPVDNSGTPYPGM